MAPGIDEQNLCPKYNSSTKGNIHDNIMRGFLEDAEPLLGPFGRNSSTQAFATLMMTSTPPLLGDARPVPRRKEEPFVT